MHAWAEQFPDGNIARRLPDTVIGIDVDAYGDKSGRAALAEAEKRWGRLPETYRCTSRDDEISGIRLFRIPADITTLRDGIRFPELGIGDIDIIQCRHRYVVVAPSRHPNGARYGWFHDADVRQLDAPPSPDDLPDLPAAWCDALDEPHGIVGASTYDGASSDLALTVGPPSPAVRERLAAALDAVGRSSRHDNTRGHTLALLRLGKQGEPGVTQALTTLMHAFCHAVTADGSRTQTEAVGPRATCRRVADRIELRHQRGIRRIPGSRYVFNRGRRPGRTAREHDVGTDRPGAVLKR